MPTLLMGAFFFVGAASGEEGPFVIARPCSLSTFCVKAKVPVLCRLPQGREGDAVVLEILVGEGNPWDEGISVEIGRSGRFASLLLDLGRIEGLKGGKRVAVRARAAGDREARSAGEPVLLRMVSFEEEELSIGAEAERLGALASEVQRAAEDRERRLGWFERTYGTLERLTKDQEIELGEFLESQRSVLESLGELQDGLRNFTLRAACAGILGPEQAGRGARRVAGLSLALGPIRRALDRLKEARRAEGRARREELLKAAREESGKVSPAVFEAGHLLLEWSSILEVRAGARRLLSLQNLLNADLDRLGRLRR